MSGPVAIDPIYDEDELDSFFEELESARLHTVSIDDQWLDNVKDSWRRGGKLVLGVYQESGDDLIGGAILHRHGSRFKNTVEIELIYCAKLKYELIVDSVIRYSRNTCRKYGYKKLVMYIDEKGSLNKLGVIKSSFISSLFNDYGFEVSTSEVIKKDGIMCLETEIEKGYTKDVYDSAGIMSWLAGEWGIDIEEPWNPDDQTPLSGKIVIDNNCNINVPVNICTNNDSVYNDSSYNIRIDSLEEGNEDEEYGCSITISQIRDITGAYVYLNHIDPKCIAVEIDKHNFRQFNPISVDPFLSDEDLKNIKRGEENDDIKYTSDAIYLDGGLYGELMPKDNNSRGYILFLEGNTNDLVVYGIGNIKSVIHGYDKIKRVIRTEDLITSFKTIHPFRKDILDVYRNIKTEMTGIVIDCIQKMRINKEDVSTATKEKVTGKNRDFRTSDDDYRKHGYRYLGRDVFDEFVDVCENEFRLPELIN